MFPSILQPTVKTVYVQHDTNNLSAQDIVHHLSKDGFKSVVMVDTAKQQAAADPSFVFVKTILTFVEKEPNVDALINFMREIDSSSLMLFVVDVCSRLTMDFVNDILDWR